MVLFTTWQCQTASYLTGAQFFWSEGNPGQAQHMPDKMEHLSQSLCDPL
jgi:hypothetical protein